MSHVFVYRMYNQCSKIAIIFFLSQMKFWSPELSFTNYFVLKTKNREDPYQTASSESICYGSVIFAIVFGRQLVFVFLEKKFRTSTILFLFVAI